MADQKVTVNIPKFTGKPSDFQMWWTRFLSYGTVYKFASCLKTKIEADMPSSQAVFDAMPEATAADIAAKKKAELAIKRNDLAMATFTMAFYTETMMNLVYKAQSDEWPQGLAHQVVDLLMKKY